MTARRKSAGSITFLVSLIIGIILCVVLLGLGFNYLLVKRSQAQFNADALALSLANKLNVADRIGEINQLQEGSRELIYVSRQDLYQSQEGKSKELISLCDRLLDDARNAHKLVENERQSQIRLSTAEIQNAALEYNRQRKNDTSFAFLGLRTYAPKIVRVDLGRIANVNSNVRDHGALPDLETFDNSKQYFDRKSKLFKADVNAKLPASDSDLDFNLTALPAFVGTAASAARNTNEHVFIPYATVFTDGNSTKSLPKQIPSAVQIYFKMDSILPWDQSTIVPIALTATGSTSGASVDSK
jgi:hypothetical protein